MAVKKSGRRLELDFEGVGVGGLVWEEGRACWGISAHPLLCRIKPSRMSRATSCYPQSAIYYCNLLTKEKSYSLVVDCLLYSASINDMIEGVSANVTPPPSLGTESKTATVVVCMGTEEKLAERTALPQCGWDGGSGSSKSKRFIKAAISMVWDNWQLKQWVPPAVQMPRFLSLSYRR